MAASLVSPVLVGRRAESEALDDALARMLEGRSATVLVGGEAGVGKSRLITEFVMRAHTADARALVGGCVELDGGGIPFAPLVEMLRALAVELDADDLDALLGPARADIGRLVPELDDGRECPSAATATRHGSWSFSSASSDGWRRPGRCCSYSRTSSGPTRPPST